MIAPIAESIAALLAVALERLPRCDAEACQRLATYNVEIDSHWGWTRCDEHAENFSVTPLLYEMDHADAVRELQERVTLTQHTDPAELLALVGVAVERRG